MNENQKEIFMDKMTQNLPALRARAGLTQAKLADMMGVSRQTLVAVENGKRKLTWGGFMSCFLVFHKNPDTDIMLKAFEINTEELDEYLGATGQKVRFIEHL